AWWRRPCLGPTRSRGRDRGRSRSRDGDDDRAHTPERMGNASLLWTPTPPPPHKGEGYARFAFWSHLDGECASRAIQLAANTASLVAAGVVAAGSACGALCPDACAAA